MPYSCPLPPDYSKVKTLDNIYPNSSVLALQNAKCFPMLQKKNPSISIHSCNEFNKYLFMQPLVIEHLLCTRGNTVTYSPTTSHNKSRGNNKKVWMIIKLLFE